MVLTDMAKKPRIYFDYNASAPLLDCARDAVIDLLAHAGNASSVHFEGRNARKHIEAARNALANSIDCNPANIVFTSGATEAANHVLCPIMRVNGQEVNVSQLYVASTEHPCILQGGRFRNDEILELPVLENGIIDLECLEKSLKNHNFETGLPLVAVQYANNETGVLQPISRVSEIVHDNDGLLLVDAVQALGKTPILMAETGADFLIVSSHKIGGPQGVGALVLANGNVSPSPLITGGGQENYHRAGTENVAAIAGFAAAIEWHSENLTKNIQKFELRDSIETGLSTISREAGNEISAPVVFGSSVERLGNTSCFSVPGVKAETALVSLDLDGIAVSSGSACSSGKVKKSHVLDAMGVQAEEMQGAVRLSLGWDSTDEEAGRFLEAWKKIIGRMVA
ncbi:MAG: cysteine desulfurase family protein [Pseudomonadota bacterium]